MTSARQAIDRLLDTVPYVRITVGQRDQAPAEVVPDDAESWLHCAALASDRDAVDDLIERIRVVRGLDRTDVTASVFSLGYAFRIASLGIGPWLLDDVVLDLDPARMWIRIERDRPNAVFLAGPALVDDPSLDTLQAQLLDRHLGPFLENVRSTHRLGARMLWSNVGSSCASAFGAFMEPLTDRRHEIRRRTEAFTAARPELANTGRVAHVGDGWQWERSACCLWYRTPGGDRCSDCSLWTSDERSERYARILAKEQPT